MSENMAHWDAAIKLVLEEDACIGASLLQRRLGIGYTVAMRLLDEMEERGLISGYDGARPRKLLVTRQDIADTMPPKP